MLLIEKQRSMFNMPNENVVISVDRNYVEQWCDGEEEMIEIITDVINGDYSLQALREDIREWVENRREFWLDDEDEFVDGKEIRK